MASSELILCLALLACAVFAFPIKLSLSQPMSSPALTLLILYLSTLVGEWASGCVGFGCWLLLNHNNRITTDRKSPSPYAVFITPCPCITQCTQNFTVQGG